MNTESRLLSSKSSASVTSSSIAHSDKHKDNYIDQNMSVTFDEKIQERNNRNIISNKDKAKYIQRNPYFIVEDRLNFTPKPLYDPSYASVSHKTFAGLPAMRPLGVPQPSQSRDGSSISFMLSRRSTKRTTVDSAPVSLPIDAPPEFHLLSTISTTDEEEEFSVSMEDRAPSMFRLREDPPSRKAPGGTFTVNLTESKTMFHIDLPSEAASTTIDQGKIIAESNSLYQKAIQTSKTKSDVATQTVRKFQKHMTPLIDRNNRVDASVFASVWDIYDTFLEDETHSGVLILEGNNTEQTADEENVEDVIELGGHKLSSRILDKLVIMERLVQKKLYSEKQLLYQGLMLQDPLSTDVSCNYSLSLLWTFESEHTKNRKVTSISWSSKDHNIVAVGYGKFNYTDKCGGLVCIWNVKNPGDPEKHYIFEDPVTYVNFSTIKTHILAVSFYSGLVFLLDITSRSIMIKASNESYPLYYPVWQAHWFDPVGSLASLALVTCGKNGRIYKYKKSKFFVSKKILTLVRPHGKIQGVELPKKCYARKTQSCQNPSAEVLVRHPRDSLIYLVGTSEGYVYTCSINHRHDHLDVFVAHHGPVYGIQFNPFCDKMFLTCGADWCIRIWAETVFEALITLESGNEAVYNAVWHPLNSTIIVSTSGQFINVWDIRRKVTTPKSTTESPSGSFNTVLRFTENKYNVCVGDADGHVHIMALAEMPFSPTFQEDVLAESILNSLISQPDLLHKLHQLGAPFAASEEFSYRAKMYRKLNYLHRVI